MLVVLLLGLASVWTDVLWYSQLGYTEVYRTRLLTEAGLFIAAGPTLRKGVLVPEFQNIHIYNLMCNILGLTPAPNDGDFSQVSRFIVW